MSDTKRLSERMKDPQDSAYYTSQKAHEGILADVRALEEELTYACAMLAAEKLGRQVAERGLAAAKATLTGEAIVRSATRREALQEAWQAVNDVDMRETSAHCAAIQTLLDACK